MPFKDSYLLSLDDLYLSWDRSCMSLYVKYTPPLMLLVMHSLSPNQVVDAQSMQADESVISFSMELDWLCSPPCCDEPRGARHNSSMLYLL